MSLLDRHIDFADLFAEIQFKLDPLLFALDCALPFQGLSWNGLVGNELRWVIDHLLGVDVLGLDVAYL